jgi:hypothetical protein
MATTVQARLDEETQAALLKIASAEGWSTSQVIRECILEGAERRTQKPRPRLVGIGCVNFGPSDLATNKEHMKNFGVKSMGKGWRRPDERKR